MKLTLIDVYSKKKDKWYKALGYVTPDGHVQILSFDIYTITRYTWLCHKFGVDVGKEKIGTDD